ncbi:MAG: L-aspartate oxidase [Lachnospiraceae bacterium]
MDNIDVIVVGTGAAGLFCALNLPREYRIIMITKDNCENSDSFLAQGGISALKGEEDYDSYFEDTMRAGHYENDKKSVEIMIKSSPEIIKDLMDYGVDFDKQNGEIEYTREGAHSTFRILHHQDITGKEITSKLLARVRERENIKILEYTTMVDFICDENQCYGIVVENDKKEISKMMADYIVLACGGLGGLFENSTNFRHITGDSLAMALKHDVKIKDISYIQIHPTVLYSKKSGRRFLISESVRGEGAILLNEDGERFINELEPRDVVTEAIKKEMDKYHTSHVYMSVQHLGKEKILTHFPNIYEHCLEEGYDMTKDLIPVTPAQHYFMGGIEVNLDSETSKKHLYAVGEASCNGVHGRNRLASNSLLESLVFAKRAAKSIKEEGLNVDDAVLEAAKEYCNLEDYKDDEKRVKEYRRLVLEEIKRKDGAFYDKWCNNESAD